MDQVRTYLRTHTNPPVFIIAGVVVLFFLLLGVTATGAVSAAASAALAGISKYFGWFYILTATAFLIFALVLVCSRYGRIRLGPDDSRPEFRTLPWFAMMFTAGMGIGLVYFGVAEPLSHLVDPPVPLGGSNAAAADQVMNYTFYHWGLHPWAIYIVLGLSMAYFCFRKGLPLRPAAAFYPLIGDRIYGWIGHLVDILAVFGTLFGLATSLGFGAQQINAGLTGLFGVPNNTGMQLLLVGLITAVAVTSVMLGLVKGIQRLALINMWLAVGLMVFVFLVGPTMFMLSGLADYTGYYLQNLVNTSFTVYSPGSSPGGFAWQSAWTFFYWGWWISWSPFVGMFIARISYGYTIRQFIAGALFAPVGASFVWFTVFGGSALFYQQVQGANIANAAYNTPENAIFLLMDQLPIGGAISGLASAVAIVVVVLFFATSSDSGSLVVDMLTNGGDPHPIKLQRFFWAVLEGLVAMVLLLAGTTGVEALQSAAITTGLPFAVVLLFMCWSLMRGLQQEQFPTIVPQRETTPGQLAGAGASRGGPGPTDGTPPAPRSSEP
jgi:choline/glycine/proline betaine transport protein